MRQSIPEFFGTIADVSRSAAEPIAVASFRSAIGKVSDRICSGLFIPVAKLTAGIMTIIET